METINESKNRRIANEVRLREANASVNSMVSQLMAPTDRALVPISFICECSNLGCRAIIKLTTDEFSIIHQHPEHFAIKPGHVSADIETILYDFETYQTVEKPALRQP